jgi:hypothetical protein
MKGSSVSATPAYLSVGEMVERKLAPQGVVKVQPVHADHPLAAAEGM